MKWKLLPFGKRKSDEELIVEIRKTIDFWDRWRYGRIIFAAILVAVWIWLLSIAITGILRMDQSEVESMALFWGEIGMLIGFLVGFFGSIVISYLTIFLTGFRSERLLLKYYDEQHSSDQSKTRRIESSKPEESN